MMTNARASIVGLTVCLLLCGCPRSEQPSGKEGGGAQVAKPPQAGDTKTVDLGGGVKLELVWCPPGTFTMGSSMAELRAEAAPGTKMALHTDEHKVTLTKGFWLGKHEVTQRQWQAVYSRPCNFHALREYCHPNRLGWRVMHWRHP